MLGKVREVPRGEKGENNGRELRRVRTGEKLGWVSDRVREGLWAGWETGPKWSAWPQRVQGELGCPLFLLVASLSSPPAISRGHKPSTLRAHCSKTHAQKPHGAVLSSLLAHRKKLAA